jgi:glutamyl-tRNA synthetase
MTMSRFGASESFALAGMAPATGGVRFAPSPTGRFHIGNLRTAFIAHAWAQKLKVPWVVRYENIDRPRIVYGARDQQRHDLEALGLHADIELLQSEFFQRHESVFSHAHSTGAIYRCTCSRKDVQAALQTMASAPHAAPAVYSGQCRPPSVSALQNSAADVSECAWRFRAQDASGAQDFIIGRSLLNSNDLLEFQPAYHWACAIDDIDGNYDLLVRSWDLESAEPLQRMIQNWMLSEGLTQHSPPPVFHTALVTQNDGHRLEKRTRRITLDELLTAHTLQNIVEQLELSFDRDAMTDSPSRGESARTLLVSSLFHGFD